MKERGIRESNVIRPYPPIPKIKTEEKVDKSLSDMTMSGTEKEYPPRNRP